MLLLDATQVRTLLPMATCMDAMADALAALDDGRVLLPLRTIIRFPDGQSAFGCMPAYAQGIGGSDAFGVKVITVFPKNEGTQYDSHLGVVLLFEAEHGELAAVMDASSITAIRTAAVTGVATRLLAREDATELALLGSGVQAITHLESMLVARPGIRRVRVWSRKHESALAFVARASGEH